MTDRPSGTVTFLFTDVEGSTKSWERFPDAMKVAIARHDAILRAAIEGHGGYVFKTVGDAFCAAFATAPAAVTAALVAQAALLREPWREVGPIRVRVALHTGATEERDGDYFGPPVNRVARLLSAGSGGQTILSQATAELLRDRLPAQVTLRDLGEHRLKDLSRPEHVYQLVAPDLPSDFPSLKTLDQHPNNLPIQPTSFVGRERELHQIKALLGTTHLLTLTGSGGCGKTRLALQSGSDLLDGFPDGVWFVDLAPLSDPSLVPQAIALALEVREARGQPILTTLLDALYARSLLLLLDNCEHLIDACARLADAVLQKCAQVRILATSRELLGVRGEIALRVPSLGLPDSRATPSVEDLRQSEAVQLFLDRARALVPDFGVSPENAPTLVGLCRRLDGIPLAIELAAARVHVLTVKQIAARLDDRFRLLTGGSRTALRRQQTLRALIDWSHDLLSDEERVLFRRLAVFAGGWSLEAAEAVCSGGGIDEEDVLDFLTGLVDKSLVQVDDQRDETRYRLLETIRQYARDRLFESGEAVPVRDRHRDWALALAEAAEPGLRGPGQVAWFSRLEVEHDNLRAALSWSLENDPRVGLRLAAALWWFWYTRTYIADDRHWLEDSLDRTGAEESNPTMASLRRRAHVGAAWMAWQQADHEGLRAHAQESSRLLRASDDPQDICQVLRLTGWADMESGDLARPKVLFEECLVHARAIGRAWDVALAFLDLGYRAQLEDDLIRSRSFYEQSLAFFRQSGDRWGIGASQLQLGIVAVNLGDYVGARPLLEESLALARAGGDQWIIEWSSYWLGVVAHAEGDYARALPLFENAVRLARDRGPFAPALGIFKLGTLARVSGDSARARALLAESLVLARDGKDTYVTKFCLGYLGVLAIEQGDYRGGARLLGSAATVEVGGGVFNYERAELQLTVATARAALGDEAFAEAWSVGQAMALDQVVSDAQPPSAILEPRRMH